MKKILLLASIFCLCLGAVACSKSSDNSTTNTDEDVNVSTDATTDANADSDTDVTTDANADSDTDVTTESSSEEETTSVDDIVAKEEIINAEWHSGLVQINDKIIQLPVSLSDLVALGLDYEIWRGYSVKKQEEKSYLIAPDEEVILLVVLNGEKISQLRFKNETSDFKMMEEFNPSIYEIDVYEKPANAAMFFPGGLTFGDSYKSVQEKLGKALEVTKDMTYVYGKVNGTNLGMEVRVDKNAQSICGFRMIKFDVE